MERKTQNGQVMIEFIVLAICLSCLFAIIRYKSIDLNKTKNYRWEK